MVTMRSARLATGTASDIHDRRGRSAIQSAAHRRAARPIALLLASAAICAGAPAAALDLMGATVTRTDLNFPVFENGFLKLNSPIDLSFSGILQDGSGTLSFDKLGTTNLTLSGANTYSGETRILGGTLFAGATNTLSANSRVRIATILDLSGFSQVVKGFYNGGTIRNDSATDAVLTTANENGVTSTFSGTINETGGVFSLVKLGTGTQNLTGSSNFTGGTQLFDGTLGIGTAGSVGSGTVTFKGAATLNGIAGVVFSNAIVLDVDGRLTGTGATFGGLISGVGGLTTGGTVTLTNNNTYSGGTTLTQGTLSVGASGALGTGTVTVANNAKLAVAPGIDVTLANAFVLIGQLDLALPSSSNTLTLNGPISGSSGIYIRPGGLGTLFLNSANSYTGPTFLGAGTLLISDAASIGNGTSLLQVFGPSTLAVTANLTVGNLVRLTSDFSVDTRGFDLTLTNAVNNAAGMTGSLTKTGAGVLTLTHANNYSNGTTFAGGSLAVASDNRLGAAAGGLTFDGGDLRVLGTGYLTTLRTIVAASTGGFDIAAAGHEFTVNSVITGAGRLGVTGAGTLTLTAANTFVGVDVDGGTLKITDSGALGSGSSLLLGTLVAGADNLNVGNAIGLSNATFDTGSNKLTLSGDLSDKAGLAGTLDKVGNGTLVLTGTNSFSGGAFIHEGVVFVGADNALGTGAGEFDGGINLTAIASVSLVSDAQLNGLVVVDDGGFDLALNGALSGAGQVIKKGAGSVALNGNNSYAGGTQLQGGTLVVGSSAALGAGALQMTQATVLKSGASVNLANAVVLGGSGATIDASTGQSLAIAGTISGAGAALTKIGTGTLALSANTYDGGTLFQAGTIRVDSDTAFGSGVVTVAGGTLTNTADHALANNFVLNGVLDVLPSNAVLVLDGVISGGSGLTGEGGTLTLNGANTYSGGSSFGQINVNIGSDTAFGTMGIEATGNTIFANISGATRTVANAIELDGATSFAGAGDLILAGTITGGSTLTKTGAHTLTLSGTNTYSAGTTLAAGRIIVDSDSALGTGTVTTAAATTLQFGSATPFSFTLANAFTLNGATTFDFVGAGTSVQADGSFTTTGNGVVLNGIIDGSGSIVTANAADLTLTAENIYSGGTTLSSGVIRIGNDKALGSGTVTTGAGTGIRNDDGATHSLANDFDLAGTVNVGGTNDLTLTGLLSNTGGLDKVGVDTLTLAHAANSYSGTTTVVGGTLNVSGSLTGGGDVVVKTGATLAGTGSISGEVTIENGGTIAPGNSPGTLTVGSLILSNTSNLGFELQTPGVGGVNDLIEVTGDLTLDGLLQITALPGFTVGNYRLINFGGTLTDNGLEFGTLPVGYVLSNLAIDASVANQISLMVNAGGILYWDGNGTPADGIVDGGSGTWNAANTNWTDSTGVDPTVWAGATGIFQGTAGTVDVADPLSFDVLYFKTTGYILTGASLAPSGFGEIKTDAGVTTTINTSITGANGFSKTGDGTLVLGGANTFLGDVTVVNGTLQIANALALGDGVFHANDMTTTIVDIGFANDIDLGGNAPSGPTFMTGPDVATLSGTISGTGSLTKSGIGELRLSGHNVYAGGTFINAGIVRAGVFDAFGTGVINVADGAGIAALDTFSLGNDIVLAGLGSIGPSNNVLTLTGAITGAGRLVKIDSGTVILTGANAYAGGTSITAGTLSVGSDANLGDAAGDIAFDAGSSAQVLALTANFTSARAIAFNANGAIDSGNFDVALSGVVSGAARLAKVGTGTLTLSGTNTYAGGTRVDQGVLSIASDANLGDAAGDVRLGDPGVGGATLRITADLTTARSIAIVEDSNIETVGASVALLAGTLTSDGLLTKIGTGTLALSGTNTGFSGGINVAAGTLSLRSNDAAGTGAITTTGSVVDYANGVDIANAVVVDSNSTQLQVTTGEAAQSGAISELNGPRPLEKIGAGTLVLNGANSFSGLFSITAGTIGVGNAQSLGLGSSVALADTTSLQIRAANLTLVNDIDVAGSATIDTNGNDAIIGGVLSGAALNKTGAGDLTLTGSNSHTGGTFLNAGSISIASDTNLGAAAGAFTFQSASLSTLFTTGDFSSGRGLVFSNALGQISTNQNSDITWTGVVSGDSLIKAGSGSLTLTNATNSYAATVINEGVLIVASDAVLGTGGVTFGGTGTGVLQLDTAVTSARDIALTAAGTIDTSTGDDLLSGIISGAGSLTKVNTSTLSLSGANTYSGGTALTAGTIRVLTNTALGAGTLTFSDGATLQAGATVSLANAIDTAGVDKVNTSGFNITLAGQVGGSGSLNKIGGGNLILTQANTYTGGTKLDNGVIVVADNAALGTNTLVMATGTSLAAGISGLVVENQITLGAVSSIFAGVTTFELHGPISGGLLNKAGVGTLILSGSNTYTGGTSLTAGAIRADTATALGSGRLTFTGGTTLQAGAAVTLANAVTTAGIDTVDTNGFDLTLGGIVGGAGSINKTGTGTLTLANANTYTGGTTLVNGAITVGTNTSLGTNTLAMAGGTRLNAGTTGLALANAITTAGVATIDSGTGTFTLGGTVSGAGSLTKVNSGTLILSGANTYAGGTALTAGTIRADTATALGTGALTFTGGTTLQAGAALTIANAVNTAGVDTVDTNGFDLTLSGVVAGAGSINKISAGTLTLANANTYTGSTTLTAGAITVGTNTSLGTNTLAMAGGTQLNAGVTGLVLANAVTTSGVATIDSGTGTFELAGIVDGAGSLAKVNTGTLTLSGVNTYSGGTDLAAGAIRVTNNASIGTGTLTTSASTTLIAGAPTLALANQVVLNGATTIDLTGTTVVIDLPVGSYVSNGSNLTLSGNISGSGSLATANFGTLTLSGDNSFSGGVTATTANVFVTRDSSLGTGTLALNDRSGLRNDSGAAVTLANAVVLSGINNNIGGSSALTLSGAISGNAGFSKAGTDTLTLSGISTYTGVTTVGSGTLNVNGQLNGGGAVNIGGDAALTGTGSIAGLVTVANGGIIAPGNSPGTLTVGALTLSNASLLNFELGQPNVIGGAFNDQLVVTSDLTLDGLLTVTNSDQFGVGIYNLITYGGALTNNGLAIASLPGAFAGLVQTLVPGRVNLIITAPGTIVQYWDGADVLGNGTIDGGTGVWDAASTNWTTDVPSDLNANWQGGVAVFGGIAGTVTLATPQAFQGLQFLTDGYTLDSSGTGALTMATPTFVSIGAGLGATIAAPLTGAGSLKKQDLGTLTLSGANTYTGGTILEAGRIAVGSNTALGTGTLAMADGTALAAATSGLVLANAVTTAGVATIDSGGGSFELNGAITGAGSLSKTGTGTLILSGSNGYAGGTALTAGTIVVTTNAALGTGTLAMSNFSTLAAGTSGLALANAVTIDGNAFIDSGTGSFALNGNVSGGGHIEKLSSGTLILSGNNSYTGGTTLTAGTIRAVTNTALGTSALFFTNGTTLQAGGSVTLNNVIGTSGIDTIDTNGFDLTLPGFIDGTGSLNKIGAGTLILSSTNIYSGGTTLVNGAITVLSNTALGSNTLAMSGGTQLNAGTTGLALANAITTAGVATIDSGTGSFTLGGIVSGAGSLTKVSSGTLILSGANTYAGGTALTAGTIRTDTATALGTGALTYTGGTTLQAGAALTIANAVNTAGVDTVDTNGFDLTLSGVVAGAGSINKISAGTLTLANANTYTGGTTLVSGAITVLSSTALGSNTLAMSGGTQLNAGTTGLTLANAITTAGVATIDSGTGTFTLGGIVGGAGSLTKVNTGTLILSGANTYAGGTALTAGTIRADTATALGSGALTFTGGTTLQAGAALTIANAVNTAGVDTVDTNGFDLTLSGVVAGAGSINKISAGTLTLANANTYTGGTTLAAGAITVTTNTSLGTNTLAMAGGTQLNAGVTGLTLANAITTAGVATIDSGAGTFTLAGTVSGAGSLTKVNTGTLILSGANTYAGGTALTAGTIRADTATALGSGALTFTGGTTLQAGAALTIANAVNTAGADTVDTNGFDLTLSGVVAGAGSINKISAGTLTLANANTYTGGTTLAAGAITVTTNTSLGTNTLAMSGGTQLNAGVTGLTLANAITTAGIATINSGTGTFTLGGVVSGAGSLTKVNTGTLILSGANTYAGGTALTTGTIRADTATALGSGALTFTGGTTLQAGAAALTLANAVNTAGADTVDTNGFDLTLSGVVAGSGSINKISAGTLTLANANTYTGGTTLTAGAITVGTNTSLGTNTLAMSGGTQLNAGVTGLTLANAVTTAGVATIDSGAGTFTLGGTISGAGSLTKVNTGTLVLSGANTYAGGTALTAGRIVVTTSSALGTGTLAFSDGTILEAGANNLVLANAVTTAGLDTIATGSFGLTLNGPVSGAGAIVKTGNGTLTLNNANSYSGGTVLTSGTIVAGNNLALGTGTLLFQGSTTLRAGIDNLVLANAVSTTNIAVIDSQAFRLTLNGAISGAGQVNKIGSGTLVLNGDNSYANGTLLLGGTISIGSNTALGTNTLVMADATTLQAGAANLVVANAITTLGAGTIDTQANTLTLTNGIGGAGGIAKTGTGTLILTGASSYTGATTLAAGTTLVNGSLGLTAVTVASGATLGGGGSIAGSVAVADGGTLSAGAPIGTLTLGSLVLNELSNVDFQLGAANTIGGPSNDLVTVTGNLTLDGQLHVADTSSFGLGIYELFSYGGTLTDNGLAIASLPGASAGLVQTLVAGQVNLIVTAPGTLIQYWDAADGIGNGAISGGSGTWSTLGTNWTGAPPSQLNANWQGGIAVFQGTAGAVTIDAPQTFQGLQFAVDGYSLGATGNGGLVTAGNAFIFAATGTSASISAPISGTGSIAKMGGGTLNLSGASSYSGGTDLQLGTLGIGSNTALGTGALTIRGGTTLVANTGGLTVANLVTTTGAGTIDSGATNLTLNGAIDGAGSIIKVGAGTLVLNGASSYAGGTALTLGQITVGNSTALGTGTLAMADATRLNAGTTGLAVANAVTTAGVATIDSGSGTFALTGAISGAGSVTKVGSGTLLLSGDNSFVNANVSTGTLAVGSNTAAGSGSVALATGTTLQAAAGGLVLANAVGLTGSTTVDTQQHLLTLNGIVGGTGSLTKTGTGTLSLTQANTYAGGTTIAAGTVSIGTATSLGSGTLTFNAGTLQANAAGLTLANVIAVAGSGIVDTQANVFTLGGTTSGNGGLTKVGSGTLILAGASTRTGPTTITAGTLSGSVATFGTGAIIDNAALVFNQGVDATYGAPISGTGTVTKAGAGNLTLTGTSSVSGATAITAGRLTVAGALTASTVTVGTGTTLAGTGSVFGLVAASGSTVSPGATDGAVGTLSVTGPATFQAGSTLAINVTPTTADRLTAGGAASLAGNLTLSAAAGQYFFNTSYTLLSASTITGTFTPPALTLFGPAFAPTLTYSGTTLVLKLVPNSLVKLLGGVGSQNILNTASAFDRATAAGFNPQAFYNLYLQGANLGPSINQLTGEIHAADRRTAIADTRYIREAALDRLGAGIAGGTNGGQDATTAQQTGDRVTSLWARAIGSWTQTDSDGNGAKLDIDTKGILTGVDTASDNLTFGALFNYIESDVDTRILGKSTVKTTGGALYAGYRAPGGFAFAAGGSVGSVKSKASRAISVPGLTQTLTGHTSGTSYQAFGDISYDLAAAGNTRVEPFARLAYVSYHVGALVETGGFAAVSGRGDTHDATFATLGLRASTQIGTSASLRGSVGYQHTGGDRTPVASLAIQGTGQFADIRAVRLDKSAFAGEAGVDFRLGKNAALGVGYSGVIGKNNSDNGVKATLSVGF